MTTTFPPAIRETPAQTARRIRRRLTERWPHHRFTVRSDRNTRAITISWNPGPTLAEVRTLTAVHDRAAGITIWASPQGHLSTVQSTSTITLRFT